MSGIAWGRGRARTMIALLVGLLLFPLGSRATSDVWGAYERDLNRQAIVLAHSEWPPGIRAAVTAGIVCAGMTPDMVRAAWGRPTHRASKGNGLDPRETWRYEGRPCALAQLGGQASSRPRCTAWTVSFMQGWVVGWTD